MIGENKTILLVEDEAIIGLREKTQLEKAGYKVIQALSGEQAVRLVAQGPSAIDLILMDIDLGDDLDGTEAAQRILAENDIPILFLSSHTEPEIVGKTEEITNYGYVVKSSSFTVLDASIKMALKLFAAKRQLDLSNREIEAKNEELHRNNEALLRTNRELAQSEDKFSKAFHTSPDSININRLSDGVYIDINEGFTRIMGYTRDDVIGRSSLPGDLGIWVRDEDRLRLVRGLREKGEYANLEAEFRKKDGSTGTGLMSARLLEINGEQCIISITRDLGEWKKTQDELKEVEQKFRLAFELSPIGISLTTLRGELRTVNHAFCGMIGYSMLEVNASDFQSFTHPGDRPLSAEIMARLLDGRSETCSFVKRFVHKDGHIVWAEVSSSLVKGGDGSPGFIISHIKDLTEQRSAMERFRLAMEASSDGIWDRDIPSDRAYYSPAYYKMLGYEEGELHLTRQMWYGLVHPDDREMVHRVNEDCVAGLNPGFDIEFRMRAKEGGYKWVRSRGRVVERDASGKSIRILGTHVDITERKRADDLVRKLFDEKELMLKEIHHRIKNNMNTVQSFLSLHASSGVDSAAALALEEAAARVRGMAVLYDRLYRGGDHDSLSVRDYVTALARDVVDNFPNRDSVELDIEAEDFRLGARVLQPLGIILNELLTNAMKHAFVGRPGGSIRLAARREGDRVVIDLRDDGVGIPESVDLANSSGFGFTLIDALRQQLGGTLSVARDGGTGISLAFEDA
ncbi:MAG TPA: PAS domain S-box protein [Rectinemataceae bacterium]|nr:PAS domain S-box protein [Rectinemataceae bacterium]